MLEEFGKVSHLPSQDYEGALFYAEHTAINLTYNAQIFYENRLQPMGNYPAESCSQ